MSGAGIEIRPTTTAELEPVSELALRSKAHWGYSADFLERCRAELTFTEADRTRGLMSSAVRGRRLVGFSLIRGEPPRGELAALFVDPAAIGSGCGRMLLGRALDSASARGFTSAAKPLRDARSNPS